MAHGCGRCAAGGALGGGNDRGGGALQGNGHEGRGRGEEHRVGLRSCLLEDSAVLDACCAQVKLLAARQEKGVGGGVKRDDLVADDRHGQRGVSGDSLDDGGLRLIHGTLTLNSC